MAQHSSAGGSTLSAVAAKALQARKTRTALGMDAAPAGQAQPAAPTTPGAGTGPDFDVDSQIEAALTPERRQELMAQIQQAIPSFTQQDAGGRVAAGSAAPTPVKPAPTIESPFEVLRPETRPLNERLKGLGAVRVSPMEQFMRVAGRAPSPRELSIFNARVLLEQELGRPPTAIELKLRIMQPELEDSSAPRAIESRP